VLQGSSSVGAYSTRGRISSRVTPDYCFPAHSVPPADSTPSSGVPNSGHGSASAVTVPDLCASI